MIIEVDAIELNKIMEKTVFISSKLIYGGVLLAQMERERMDECLYRNEKVYSLQFC